MQAVVDFHGLFMDTYIGWPGKVHDARVFLNSSICHKGREDILLPGWKRQINGVEVCMYVILSCALSVKFYASGSIINPWRFSLPSATMANETIYSNTEHNLSTKAFQLSSKQSLDGSRKCFW